MDHLTDEQLKTLRAQLVRQRAQLLTLVNPEGMQEEDVHAEPEDIQDRARDERDRSRSILLTHVQQARLHEIEEALARMESGEYGICEESGEEIAFARLQANPAARYTVEAQEMIERQERDGALRPFDDDPSDGY